MDPLKNTPGITTNDALAAGAGAALSGNVGDTQQSRQQQLLQTLAASGLLHPSALTELTSFGAAGVTPQAPVQYQPPSSTFSRPIGSFGTVGERKRADREAIFTGIANTVRSAGDYIQQKKLRSMQMNTELLMGALQGYNEAQASGDKDALAHNAKLINNLLDPTTSEGKKRIKEFQKVFNVNLLGESKDKNTPEYKGFVTAFQKFQQDQGQAQKTGQPNVVVNPLAQKLMGMMPQRLQIDPRLAAAMEATKAGVLPSAAEQLKAQTEITKIFTAAQEKGFDRESRENIAKTLAESKDRATQGMITRTIMQELGRQGAAGILAQASKYRADKAYDAVMNNPRWQLMRDRLGKDTEDKSLNAFSNAIDKQMKALEKNKDQVDKAIAADQKKHNSILGSWFQDKDLVAQQQDLNNKIKKLQNQQDAVIHYYMQKYDDNLDQATTPAEEENKDEQELEYTPEEQQELDKILNQ